MLKLNTKELLAEAFVELCKTKPLEKITIQDIVNFCGAGRQTFYNHFKDKEDLIAYIFLNDERKCVEKLREDCSIKERTKSIFDVFVEKKQFYVSAYITHGQNSLGDVIFEHYVDYHTEQIAQKTGKYADEKLKTAICFHCYGSIGYVRRWMEEGMRLSSEEMADIIIENMPERLKKYFD